MPTKANGAAARSVHPMDALKERLQRILASIPPGSNIHYLDYPVYNNGGDLLIMKGAEAFFRANGIRVRGRYSVLDYPDGLPIPADQIIVLQGGGNFGDLYPTHQRFREKIVAAYPNHRIVILPQTIHYKDESAFDLAAEVFNRHPDVHLYVRDPQSFEAASRKFHRCQVVLSPDMAHQLWPIEPRSRPEKELLCFFRTDIEKTGYQDRLEREAGDYMDWGSLYNKVERKSIRVIGRMLRNRGSASLTQAIWGKYSDYLVGKAIRTFSGYRHVRTSRLHGHILSCLLDKPNVLLDNSYGKNSNYYRTWTETVASARMGESQ